MSSLLMNEFLKWVHERPRTYDETMEAWRSSCPRLTVWEDALSEKLVEMRTERNASRVCLTSRGLAAIAHCAPVKPSSRSPKSEVLADNR